MLGRLGVYGDPDVIAEAQKRFDDHISGKSIIPADLRSPIYKTVMTVGDESTYETMLKVKICPICNLSLVFDQSLVSVLLWTVIFKHIKILSRYRKFFPL